MTKRQQIYEGLKKHYGSQKRLAKEQGVTREWVRMVLNGEQEDEKLLAAAAKLWLELEQERVQALKEAEEYADQAAALALT
ncbi:MAG: hypothetical protein EPGJADBJ_04438 [Saprospiraceae bacterium]|nr:hypothetical protein [Saprospiraceae bacterium]